MLMLLGQLKQAMETHAEYQRESLAARAAMQRQLEEQGQLLVSIQSTIQAHIANESQFQLSVSSKLKEIDDLKDSRAKLIGMVSVFAVLGGGLGSTLKSLLGGGH